ncbi:ribosome maturation factor RimM [Candidatus Leptofilum sp.]|uniref:ribosome maturation factor RimM n=1 Tax=Candidatus Leptofilum sp. TaxID=3241576 RepID=UPI003B5C62D7
MKKKQSVPANFDDLGFIVIGVITKPHGVRGEVRVKPLTDEPARFTWLEQLYVGADDPQPMAVEQARVHQEMVLLKLTAVSNRSQAESLRGEWLMVPEEEALSLEEGEYFLFQLEGLTVITADGETLGTLTSIIETGANNVFVVQGEHGELLLPDIDDVVQEIDFDNGRMIVTLLPGLLP